MVFLVVQNDVNRNYSHRAGQSLTQENTIHKIPTAWHMVSSHNTEETVEIRYAVYIFENPIIKRYAYFHSHMCLWRKYAHSKIKATRPNDKI